MSYETYKNVCKETGWNVTDGENGHFLLSNNEFHAVMVDGENRDKNTIQQFLYSLMYSAVSYKTKKDMIALSEKLLFGTN